jgi:hypothetical protein
MAKPYFRCPLFPDLVSHDGGRIGRFFLPTSWQIRRATRAGVEGAPRRYDSLLNANDLYHSVLPYEFRRQHHIDTRPLAIPMPPWRDVPCTAATADIWLLSANKKATMRLSLLVRLPKRRVESEPPHPLIGYEFLRHYEPRLVVNFTTIPHVLPFDSTTSVGHLEWR